MKRKSPIVCSLFSTWFPLMVLLMLAATLILWASGVVPSVFPTVHADNFTDVFYTNSFRGSFNWFKKLDWIGMVVQAVISVFSLVGVALIVIRIMTSMLYLSAKGLWEEVHDLKQSGGESEMYDFGLVNMAKSWAKGKGGYTGLDAILGAVLTLLPDVKRYSDFGEKSGQNFEQDITMSQYMLKIALPTVMAVFFLAMGFNGTLVQGLAVTVDAMGTIADKAVSVNYSGFIEDLVNSGSGYKFTYGAMGTERGKLAQSLAKDLYGRAVSNAREASEAQLYQIGLNVQEALGTDLTKFDEMCRKETPNVSSQIRGLLDESEANSDKYYAYLGYDIIQNTSETAADASADISLDSLMDGTYMATDGAKIYYHIYLKQSKTFGGTYMNMDDLNR